jgi:hypothetical protein
LHGRKRHHLNGKIAQGTVIARDVALLRVVGLPHFLEHACVCAPSEAVFVDVFNVTRATGESSAMEGDFGGVPANLHERTARAFELPRRFRDHFNLQLHPFAVNLGFEVFQDLLFRKKSSIGLFRLVGMGHALGAPPFFGRNLKEKKQKTYRRNR